LAPPLDIAVQCATVQFYAIGPSTPSKETGQNRSEQVRLSRIGLLGRQFRAADLVQHQIVPRQAPQNIGGDARVFVAKHVADARDFSPRNFRVPCFRIFR
jgi:hypothetical protein